MKFISYCGNEGMRKKKQVTNRDWEGKENIKQNRKLGF